MTTPAQLARRSRRELPAARAREAITRSISRVLTRVATPVATHVEAIRPLVRASDRTPTDGPPVVRAVRPDRMRSTVAAGTEYVCVARSTRVPRAVNVCTASDTPTHLVGCMSQPNCRRVRSMNWADCRAPRAESAPKMMSSK